MKKVLSLLVVVVLAGAGVVPALAAPAYQGEDPVIECDIEDTNCEQVDDVTIKFNQFGYGSYWYRVNETSDLYFYGQVGLDWWHNYPWSTDIQSRILYIDEATWLGELHSGVSANNHIALNDVVSTQKTDVAAGEKFINAYVWESNDVIQHVEFSGESFMYVSAEPISDCDEKYVTPSVDIYEIDPTIEMPLGPTGTPADDQLYGTVIGQYYEIYTYGSWNDGTNDSEDVAISWDGITWTTLSSYTSDCETQVEINGELASVYYLVAESETFHVRADDVGGAFENNTNNDPPITYAIGWTSLLEESGCSSQFTYDEQEDWQASIVIQADVNGTLAYDGMIVGEWYGIEVASGTWQDEGTGIQRQDMEYLVISDIGDPMTYVDLSGGSDGVWCQSTMDEYITYIQATGTDLYLRVNNEVGDFENNTGQLGVNIYHTTFDRRPQSCETIVNQDTLIESIEVDASKWLGSPVGTAMEIKIVPGQWYVLETELGPWTGGGGNRYDMAIQVKSIWDSVESPWMELEDFEASCNIPIDAVGHRKIIFKAPDDYGYSTADNPNKYPSGVYYRLRVDRELLGIYGGSMGWKLYGATISTSQQNTCLDGIELTVINEFEWIDEKSVFGETLLSDNIRWPEYVALVPGTTYVVQSPVDPFDCAGDAGSACKFQVSSDGGTSWYRVDDEMSPLTCFLKEDAPSNIYKGKFVMQEGQKWMIRVNDVDGDFLNNTGATSFKLYKDCHGEECIPLDEDELPGVSIQGGGDVCKIPIVRPGPLSLEEIASLGSYVGNWLNYVNLSVMRFMAWCPHHTSLINNVLRRLTTLEPFASITEIEDIGNRVKDEVESYDWGDNAGTGESIFDIATSGEFIRTMQDKLFGKDREVSVWNGGQVLDFSDNNLPQSYYACGNAFTNVLPSRLRTGVCFVSAYFIETSASFWIQLLIDIGALFFAINITINAIGDAFYMFTGIRIRRSSLSVARRSIESFEQSEAAKRQEARDENEELLRSQFGGSWRRNRNGTYSRR